MSDIERRRRKYYSAPDYAELETRFPDWLVDDAVDQREDTPGSPTDPRPHVVFPEEALLFKDDEFKSFVPKIDGLTENSQVSDYQEVFGKTFEDSGSKFDEFLRGLFQRIRNYNASLYWLRLVHLNHPQRSVRPPVSGHPPIQTDNGPRYPDSIPDPTEFSDPNEKPIKPFEEDLHKCVDAIREHIRKGFYNEDNNRLDVFVDAIKVNDYVYSVRVIATDWLSRGSLSDDDDLRTMAPEIPGSSSSYTYISSPYSSTSP